MRKTFFPVMMAWAVHLFTASGAVAGFLALLAVSDHRWKAAFVWMGAAIAIDAVDGALARMAGVRDVLPGFDGALLDNVVDYFTYTVVPAYLFYEAALLPESSKLPIAASILLVSAYQFCRQDAKTATHYFTGFPSYWNIAAFYLHMLNWPTWGNALLVGALLAAVFIPIRYLYPSRTLFLRRTTLLLSGVWGVLMVAALVRYPEPSRWLIYGSLAYVLYYFSASVYATAAGKAA